LLVFAAVLPKSINCCGGAVIGRRIPASKLASFFCLSARSRRGTNSWVRGEGRYYIAVAGW
jgi:hypothetical protein